MKFNKTDNYLTLGQVAQHLGVANNTIKRWYQWYEDDTFNKPTDLELPKYHYFDRRGTKFFEKTDLPLFEDFQAKLQRGQIYWGIMAEFNQQFIQKKENEVK